ncbi:MAG: M14 family metallopeptidase [Planctomycetota bacterium]|jgi:hypothetical protein|nr:M14 family metallopeptidase [Planctomycetota bacterium]MDP7249179.1 M14 family metallopeptidase [Planctomycetota bacterium]
MAKKKLPNLPFKKFFTHEEFADFLKKLPAARPDLCQLSSLGKSREDRDVSLLTITDFSTGAAEDKPAYLIQGNIHAGELAGTHAALYTAQQLLADAPKSDLLKRVAFYMVPRLNPDGAHYCAATFGKLRSRTDRSEREPNTLYQEDVNGDGVLLSMRQRHPDGQFVKDPKDSRLMIRRRSKSKGPFYRVFPEGVIHVWDGTDNLKIEGRSFDWNRNWSYDWRPEPEQGGAGDFPFSEPEMHALGEFIHSRPNIYGVLGYHTGPAAVLRPPSTGSLSDLDAGDDRMMDDIARIGEKHTGFPIVPVVKYRNKRDRDCNLRGHFHNFGYHHLGLFVFEFELGQIWDSAGISTDIRFATETEEEQEQHLRKVMKWWDRQKRREPLFEPWKRFKHPQLGQVEVGGFIFPHQINPTLKALSKISRDTYKFTLEHAEMHPQVVLEEVAAEKVGDDVWRIRARVANRGELPTHVTNKGRGLRRLRPVKVEFRPAEGVELLSNIGHKSVGHLGGVTGSRDLEWFVGAGGKVKALCEIRVLGGTGGNCVVEVGA